MITCFFPGPAAKIKIGPIQMSLDGVGTRRAKDSGKGTSMQPAAHRQGFRISRPSSRTPRCLGCDVGFWAWRMTITCLADIQSSSYTRSGKWFWPSFFLFHYMAARNEPPARS